MCIAIIKPEGVDIPTDEVLEECFYNNPDGAGYAYCNGKSVVIRKGFMDFYDFIDSFMKSVKQYHGAFIHFRIATHGEVIPELCHPFPITSDMNTMRERECVAKEIMMHNGILHAVDSAKNVSDTMSFAKIMHETGLHNAGQNSESAANMINMAIRGSKVAFMWATGEITYYGDGWIKEKNGVIYSNSSYKKSLWKKTASGFTIRDNELYDYSEKDYSDWWTQQYGVKNEEEFEEAFLK